MLDYDIIKVFRPIIIQGLADNGLTADVLMNYQPTKQSIKNNVVYFFAVNDSRNGFVSSEDYYDEDEQQMKRVDTQYKETIFQINTIVKQDPENLNITAKDLCSYVNMILQSRESIQTLNTSGIGILRITEIRNVPFKFGDDNYGFNPSFDITITHTQNLIYNINKIDTFSGIYKKI